VTFHDTGIGGAPIFRQTRRPIIDRFSGSTCFSPCFAWLPPCHGSCWNRLDTWHLLILSVVRWNMLSHTNKYHELCRCYKHVVSATDEARPVLLKPVVLFSNVHQVTSSFTPIFTVYSHQYVPSGKLYNMLVGGLEHFFIYWEYHHPNWRTHIFQRGRSTTNQHGYCIGDPFMFDLPNGPNLKIVIFHSLIYQRGTSIYHYLPFIHIMFSIFISHVYIYIFNSLSCSQQ